MIEARRCSGAGGSGQKPPAIGGHRNGFHVSGQTSACPPTSGLAGRRRSERRWRASATLELRREALRSGGDGRGEAAWGRGWAGRP